MIWNLIHTERSRPWPAGWGHEKTRDFNAPPKGGTPTKTTRSTPILSRVILLECRHQAESSAHAPPEGGTPTKTSRSRPILFRVILLGGSLQAESSARLAPGPLVDRFSRRSRTTCRRRRQPGASVSEAFRAPPERGARGASPPRAAGPNWVRFHLVKSRLNPEIWRNPLVFVCFRDVRILAEFGFARKIRPCSRSGRHAIRGGSRRREGACYLVQSLHQRAASQACAAFRQRRGLRGVWRAWVSPVPTTLFGPARPPSRKPRFASQESVFNFTGPASSGSRSGT